MKKKKVTHPVKKGTKYELEIVHKICDALGLAYGKDLKRRPRGEKGDDIVHLSLRGFKKFPFSIESKDRRNWSINTWWDKLIEDRDEDLVPALVLHRHQTKVDYVILTLDDFLELVLKTMEDEPG